MLEEKKRAHERFWRGEGPSLILMPADQGAKYDTDDYRRRFDDPRLMWEAEMGRARAAMDWPTDGIPTVRPNLGVVFLPAIAGQGYQLRENQMPWPGEPLDERAIRAIADIDIESSDMMRRAAAFYAIHKDSGETEVIAYHPDTQGVFDVAHLLYGNAIFCDAVDDARADWMRDLLDLCLNLYVRASRYIKHLLGEPDHAMVHGHACPQGVYFPHAGVRVSEDTAILFSPQTIESIIMPYVERAAEPFGGAFAHFCGCSEGLFAALCRSPWIRAIDLQPGMHNTRWLFEQCAQTDTVLYGIVPAEPGEDWPAYTRRIASMLKSTGARCILRPAVFPSGRAECAAMCDLWRELTA